jgi:hypothetical protein
MTASARLSLATLRAEAGDLEGADALLTSILAARLPGYQDARHAYDTAATAKREELLRRAQLGDIPRELDDQMRYADGESQAQIFVRWAAHQLDDDPALATRAVELLRRASASPALGHPQQVAWGLVLVAELRAAEANEAFRAEWQDGRRRYDADVLLYRACFGSNGDAVLPALRDQPELREAATLVGTSPGPRPRVSDWVLARVVGDAELEARSRPALTRDEVVIAARIDALLRPGHPGPVATLAMLGSVGVQ